MKHIICPVCSSDKYKSFLSCLDYLVSKETYDLLRCTNCDFVWTDNAPDAANIGSYYVSEEYIAHTDTQSGLINRLFHTARRYMLSRKRLLIHKNTQEQSKTLLDIGCGTGYFLNYMRANGWNVNGLEPSQSAREFARKQFALSIQPSENIETLADSSFDVITLWHVLEHVHDLKGTVNHLHRLLKQNGLLVVALPNRDSWDSRFYKQSWAAYDVPRHLWHFNPASFAQLIELSDFELIGKKPMPLDAYYVSMLSEKQKEKVSPIAPIKGMISGFWSNIMAGVRADKSSSIIYLLRKHH